MSRSRAITPGAVSRPVRLVRGGDDGPHRALDQQQRRAHRCRGPEQHAHPDQLGRHRAAVTVDDEQHRSAERPDGREHLRLVAQDAPDEPAFFSSWGVTGGEPPQLDVDDEDGVQDDRGVPNTVSTAEAIAVSRANTVSASRTNSLRSGITITVSSAAASNCAKASAAA
jgi:hypothetical protein